MAVHPDAEVATGIQRLAAERTRRPSGLDERRCGSGEPPGMCGSEPNAQEVRAVWFLVGDLGVVTILVDGPRFDQERSGVGVPAKGEHPHSEDLDHRFYAGIARIRSCRGRRRLADGHQQLRDALCERTNLSLLQADGDDRLSLASLEVEGSAARLTDGSGEEPIRLIEDEEAARHGPNATGQAR